MLEMINSAWRILGPLMLVGAVIACVRVIRSIFDDVIDDLRGKRVFAADTPRHARRDPPEADKLAPHIGSIGRARKEG